MSIESFPEPDGDDATPLRELMVMPNHAAPEMIWHSSEKDWERVGKGRYEIVLPPSSTRLKALRE
jgi:hypothetical protein